MILASFKNAFDSVPDVISRVFKVKLLNIWWKLLIFFDAARERKSGYGIAPVALAT